MGVMPWILNLSFIRSHNTLIWFVVCRCSQCVQEMGNAKAKRLYEAFLPECFQRPETDQSAEIFIRDKYDKKKYMDKVIDIQMLRVSQHTHTYKPPIHIFIREGVYPHIFSLCRKKRAVTIYPRSQLCLRRWNWWVQLCLTCITVMTSWINMEVTSLF